MHGVSMSSEVGVNLIILREHAHMTQEEVADAIGTIQSTVWRHEKTGKLSREMVKKYAELYKVSADIIMGTLPVPSEERHARRVPIVGTIACGEPILAVEEYEDYIELPASLTTGKVIALYVKGDSMIGSRLFNGDLALIKVQEVVEDGEIAAVCVGDSREEATIKKVRYLDGYISLVPSNESYLPTSYRPDQIRIICRGGTLGRQRGLVQRGAVGGTIYTPSSNLPHTFCPPLSC